MGTSSIPVDLLNPGQVFACMGFLEAAEHLCGDARGGFQWNNEHDSTVCFILEANCDNPVAQILEFLANAMISEMAPDRWITKTNDSSADNKKVRSLEDVIGTGNLSYSKTPEDKSLSICLAGGDGNVVLTHWSDGARKDKFKLYGGNRSAFVIARNQLKGKTTPNGKIVKVNGVCHLLENHEVSIKKDPFGISNPNLLIPMEGKFNMDARCAWEGIHVGYSPKDQKQKVKGSPIVEIMAAWGLEHARPRKLGMRDYQYMVWLEGLPPVLARPMLSNGIGEFDCRLFSFRLGGRDDNKIIQYAEEEKG